jgi:hypothetical protein
MRLLRSIAVGCGTLLLFSVFFTPIGGLVAGVIVARQSHVGRGDGTDASARWFVGNFMVTGVCAGAVFLICLGISAALSALTPIRGAVGVLGAIGVAVYAWVTTWQESEAPGVLMFDEPLEPLPVPTL